MVLLMPPIALPSISPVDYSTAADLRHRHFPLFPPKSSTFDFYFKTCVLFYITTQYYLFQLPRLSDQLEKRRKCVNLNIRTSGLSAQPPRHLFAAKSQRPTSSPPTTILLPSTSTTRLPSTQLNPPIHLHVHGHVLELERTPRRLLFAANATANDTAATDQPSIRPPPTSAPSASRIE